MNVRVLGAAELAAALPMADAIAAMRGAFEALAAGEVAAPPRVHLTAGRRTTLLMAASGAAGRIAKVVNIFPENGARGLATTTGLVSVYDPATGHLRGLCDGGALTAIRTGAVAGLATTLLAREGAEVGAVLGAGGQARTQVLALAAARRLREIRIYAPRPARVAALVRELGPQLDVPLVAAPSSAAAIDAADVVCAATSSATPVLDGDRLRPGAHVNGVGSYRLDMRELDERTIARAASIVVDRRESALHEAGELVAAAAAGITSADRWVELGELLAEPARGRRDAAAITVFKSVGHAVQDLFAVAAAFDRAERDGLGRTLDLA